MFFVTSTRELRPLGVLLGGSGLVPKPPPRTPRVAVLLTPRSPASVLAHQGALAGASAVRPC